MNKNFNDGIIFNVDNKFLQTPTKADNIIHGFPFHCFSKSKKNHTLPKGKLIVIKLQILFLEKEPFEKEPPMDKNIEDESIS